MQHHYSNNHEVNEIQFPHCYPPRVRSTIMCCLKISQLSMPRTVIFLNTEVRNTTTWSFRVTKLSTPRNIFFENIQAGIQTTGQAVCAIPSTFTQLQHLYRPLRLHLQPSAILVIALYPSLLCCAPRIVMYVLYVFVCVFPGIHDSLNCTGSCN